MKVLLDQDVVPDERLSAREFCCLSEWTKNFDSERALDIIYLDFSKVFDKVPKVLLHKLNLLGLLDSLLRWISSFLSDQIFRVGDAFSRYVNVVSDVPQSTVLGPLLFIAYTANIKGIISFSTLNLCII